MLKFGGRHLYLIVEYMHTALSQYLLSPHVEALAKKNKRTKTDRLQHKSRSSGRMVSSHGISHETFSFILTRAKTPLKSVGLFGPILFTQQFGHYLMCQLICWQVKIMKLGKYAKSLFNVPIIARFRLPRDFLQAYTNLHRSLNRLIFA